LSNPGATEMWLGKHPCRVLPDDRLWAGAIAIVPDHPPDLPHTIVQAGDHRYGAFGKRHMPAVDKQKQSVLLADQGAAHNLNAAPVPGVLALFIHGGNWRQGPWGEWQAIGSIETAFVLQMRPRVDASSVTRRCRSALIVTRASFG